MPSKRRSSTIKSQDVAAPTFVVGSDLAVADFLDLATAVANLPPEGGSINLLEGTYPISQTITLPNKSVVIRGAGRATVISLGSNAISAFAVPDGLTENRIFEFADFHVLGNSTVGQKFLALDDSNGLGDVHCLRVSTLNVEKVFDYTDYDQSYSHRTEVACWDCQFTAPDLAGAHLVKTVNPGGTYNGWVEAKFYGCEFDDEVLSLMKSWKIDGDIDLLFDGCRVLRMKVGSAFDGLSASQSDFSLVGTGTITVYGPAGPANITITDCSINGADATLNIQYFAWIADSTVNTRLLMNTGAVWFVAIGCWFPCGNGTIGVELDGITQFASITGCLFQAGAFTTAALRINNSIRCSVVGNTFIKGAGAGFNTLVESGTSDENTIAENIGLYIENGPTLIGAKTLLENEQTFETSSTPHVVAPTDRTILINASGGNKTVNLPTAAKAKWRVLTVKKIDASGNTVTVDGDGGETIDGAATVVLTLQWERVTIQSNGTAWFRVD